jgi:hypothetical protein
VSVAAPEVGENDHTSDRRICTPKRGERISLELHHDQSIARFAVPKITIILIFEKTENRKLQSHRATQLPYCLSLD